MSEPLRCLNRELRVLVYASVSPIHGRGLFARRAIAAGEYIGTYWGRKARRNGRYVLWVSNAALASGYEGCSGRNLLRYLNHALLPNAAFDGFDLYACNLIAVDQEITIDYGPDYFGATD